MDVRDRVPGVVAAVEDAAKSLLVEAELAGQLAGATHQGAEEGIVGRLDREQARDVALGNHQDVVGSLRVGIGESKKLVVLIENLRGNARPHDLAKDARHGCGVYTAVRRLRGSSAAARSFRDMEEVPISAISSARTQRRESVLAAEAEPARVAR